MFIVWIPHSVIKTEILKLHVKQYKQDKYFYDTYFNHYEVNLSNSPSTWSPPVKPRTLKIPLFFLNSSSQMLTVSLTSHTATLLYWDKDTGCSLQNIRKKLVAASFLNRLSFPSLSIYYILKSFETLLCCLIFLTGTFFTSMWHTWLSLLPLSHWNFLPNIILMIEQSSTISVSHSPSTSKQIIVTPTVAKIKRK